MNRFWIVVFLLLQSAFCQALVCQDIFARAHLYEDPRANQIAFEILDISKKMVETPSRIQKNVLQFKMNRKTKKLASLLTTFKNHPGPLFVVKEFSGEFYWETTVTIRVGAIQTRTPYLTAAQREDLRFELSDQQIYYGKEKLPLEKYILGDFVIGIDGEMYIAYDRSQLPHHFRHSSFFAGGPVLFAGVIGLQPDGRVAYLSRKSGHYQPPVEYFVWVQNYLRSIGYKVPNNLVDRIDE
ncbi:hypothetical protein K2X05_13985 [bacterium]|nr:hypothetical protein [bacterium]